MFISAPSLVASLRAAFDEVERELRQSPELRGAFYTQDRGDREIHLQPPKSQIWRDAIGRIPGAVQGTSTAATGPQGWTAVDGPYGFANWSARPGRPVATAEITSSGSDGTNYVFACYVLSRRPTGHGSSDPHALVDSAARPKSSVKCREIATSRSFRFGGRGAPARTRSFVHRADVDIRQRGLGSRAGEVRGRSRSRPSSWSWNATARGDVILETR
jgi:hypothetical protein